MIRLLTGDVRDMLATLPDASVQCVVTSPPYYGLRSYLDASHPDKHRELGSEATPDEYIQTMVQVFREVKRVLRPDGCCFVNLGDSYCSGTSNVRYVLREDCTLTELQSVALEVLGVRVTGDEETGQGLVSQVLRGGVQGQAVCGEPSLARRREQDQLSAASVGGYRENDPADQADEDRCDSGVGRQVRVLWGDDTPIPDAGSHPRGWSGAPEAPDRQEPSIVGQDISGGAAARLSEGPVSRPLLQLQLRDRIMGLLSSRQFTADEIPASVRACFKASGLKPKDLLGMPWRFALALQADGWYLRSSIIWSKPNPMPEGVTDRPTNAHEHVFLLTKRARYFYDAEAVAEDATSNLPIVSKEARSRHRLTSTADPLRGKDEYGSIGQIAPGRRSLRNVWTIATAPFSNFHYATFPPELAERCIRAGSRPGDSILDPFSGAGTALLVADRLGRDAIGIDLSHAYVEMARERLQADCPLFADITNAPVPEPPEDERMADLFAGEEYQRLPAAVPVRDAFRNSSRYVNQGTQPSNGLPEAAE